MTKTEVAARQEIPSIETEHGEIEACPDAGGVFRLAEKDYTAAHISWVLLRLRMGYEDTVQAAIERYMQTLRLFEQARNIDGDSSYSIIEIAKLHIADALLEELRFPTKPAPPAFLQKTTQQVYVKTSIPVELRWQVWERDNFTCLHCGARRRLTVDHIIPESKGGTLELSNLQTLCGTCNSKKGDR